MLLRRLLWAFIIGVCIMIPVGALNYIFYPDSSNVPQAQRSVAQELATQQRNATFYTITKIDMMLSFLIGFVIADRYFAQYPNRQNMIELHKKITKIQTGENIPDKYYKADGIISNDEAQKEASFNLNLSIEANNPKENVSTESNEQNNGDKKDGSE